MTERAEPSDGGDYARVARAIDWLCEHSVDQPSLAAAAAAIGLSEFHFQRLFVAWAGVSPKEFLQALTLVRAKRLLRRASVLDAALGVGLSGPSRLHDLFLRVERVTPGEWKRAGAGLVLRYAVGETRFGPALFSASERGLCGLGFIDSAGGRAQALEELRARWPGAQLVEDAAALAPSIHEVDRRMRGLGPASRLGVVLKGSELRLTVWTALLALGPGDVLSYSELAERVGAPRAVRAVASCVADNPIGWLIPCHRVIQKSGAVGDYRWTPARKQLLLASERCAAVARGSATG